MRTWRIWSGWRLSGRVVMARSPGGSIARGEGEGVVLAVSVRLYVCVEAAKVPVIPGIHRLSPELGCRCYQSISE